MTDQLTPVLGEDSRTVSFRLKCSPKLLVVLGARRAVRSLKDDFDSAEHSSLLNQSQLFRRICDSQLERRTVAANACRERKGNHMKQLSLAMLIIFVAATGLLQAQKQKDPCADAQTTIEMRNCAGKEYKQADDELNRVYRHLMAKLDDEGHKTALKTAQQAWIKYRDANCDFASYLNRGGTIEPVVRYNCMTSMTSSRTKELKDQLTGD